VSIGGALEDTTSVVVRQCTHEPKLVVLVKADGVSVVFLNVEIDLFEPGLGE